MFKPTPCLGARLRLTTKQVNKGYYKGNRTGNVGFFGKHKGTYYIDYRKVRTYVVPEGLNDFHLSPFVTKRMEPTKSIYTKTMSVRGREIEVPRAMSGQDYLDYWYLNNQEESDQLEEYRKAAGMEDQGASSPEEVAGTAEAQADTSEAPVAEGAVDIKEAVKAKVEQQDDKNPGPRTP
ncbi:hypothetical protein AJ79_01455 [Helicocarpus griseus UAMH5409]|uniref:Ribosomal protein L27 n=1 Tax=Helicocarpus griseus UAMH5409 TaxID=1447875 RepID=A0A2B7Y6Y7_9EURO|nr:hypothetical protein AJ79_01455 [Helicocarpus griseus UAMH5409]